MNRGEQRTQVRILLGETVGDGYLDAEINTALNTSNLILARDLLCLMTYREIETVAYNDPLLTDPDDIRKTGRYGLPDDFLSMVDVQVMDGGTWHILKNLRYDEFQERARTVQGGRPIYYRLEFGAVRLDSPKAGDLWLYPYPDAVYTLRRVYMQKPTAMTLDTDTSELPEVAHLGACYHAAMVLSRKWKDRVLIQEMIALWQDEEKRIKGWVNVQDQTDAFRVRNVYGR